MIRPNGKGIILLTPQAVFPIVSKQKLSNFRNDDTKGKDS